MVRRSRALGVLFLVATLLGGCATPVSGLKISHVHGLAFNAETSEVFLATHHGVAKGTQTGDGWQWQYVGSDRFDYMGFTQDAVQSGTFYSSGHPDNPRAFGAVHLGLRRSTDGAQTWDQQSLKGLVDFHALTGLPSGAGHLAGSWQGAIKVSRDAGRTWTDHSGPAASVYALAASNGTLWAGTQSGLQSTTDFATWQDADGGRFADTVSSVAASPDGRILLVGTGDGRTGSSYISRDGGTSWTQLSPDPLRVAAAAVLFALDSTDDRHLFASSADANVLESTDQGLTWTTLRDSV